MTPIEELAERLRQIGTDILDIRAHHRLRPHIFTEDKSDLARKAFRLADDLKAIGRLPPRAATPSFTTGAVAGPTGRMVRVERRRAA